MLEPRSALADALTHDGRAGADGQRRLRLGELRPPGILEIAAFTTTWTDFQNAIRPVLIASLPIRIGEVLSGTGLRLLKTGAQRYWIFTDDPENLWRELKDSVAPGIGTITPLLHSRTRIVIEGDAARQLLAKGIALDFHPDVFGIDQFALTALHHSPILIHRSMRDRYELYAMRTFARSVWDWMTDAALALGWDVFTGEGK